MGALDYAHGLYGIGSKGRKGKHGTPHYSTTEHIADHLSC